MKRYKHKVHSTNSNTIDIKEAQRICEGLADVFDRIGKAEESGYKDEEECKNILLETVNLYTRTLCFDRTK